MNKVRVIQFAQYGVTNVHPLAILFMAIMVALTFSPKRTTAVLAVLSVCVFMPMEQRIVLAGLDFSMVRLILLVGWMRVLVRGEYRGVRFGKLDRLFILWVLSASFFYVVGRGTSGIVYRLGVTYDMFTAFFLIRVLVRTPSDVLALWRHLGWIVIALAPFLVYEATAKLNPFGVFKYAGVDFVDIRDGRARAQGPLSHPILAGTLAAVTIPVFIGIFLGTRSERKLSALACVSALMIIMSAGSSGALIASAVGIFGWAIWRFREYVRLMLASAVGMAVVIHFIREKPVWHLILRLESFMGGQGSHRYYLIDAFIRRFGEWAVAGTRNTAQWGWGLQDTTNQYVAEGVRGGLVTLVLFLLLLRTSFVQLRQTREVLERLKGRRNGAALLTWGTSVSLTVHCVSFISVSYFGHMVQFFVMFLATFPALAGFRYPQRVKTPTTTTELASSPIATPTDLPAKSVHS